MTLVGESLNDVLNPLLRTTQGCSQVRPARRTAGTGDAVRMTRAGQPVLDGRATCGSGIRRRRGPVRAVDGVSFTLRPGEVLGLVGESGCGKSTLGRGLMGLMPARPAVDGTVALRRPELLALPKRERDRLRGAGLGLIFQEPMTRLDPLMRISEHFDEALRRTSRRCPRSSARRARSTRCGRWASRRRATTTTRTSSPAACGSAS